MVLGKLGEQIVAISEKTFDALNFEEAILVENEVYFPKKLARDNNAKNEFKKRKGKRFCFKRKVCT